MKKIIFIGLALILLIVIIICNKTTTVSEIIKPYSTVNLPEEMKTSIYISYFSSKELNVTNYESKKEIINFLSSIKVKKPLVTPPKIYNPKLKETYHIFMNNYEEEGFVYIYILNKKYIRINDNTFKISNNPDLLNLYNIIINDQPKGSIDEFYYNLIE